MLQLRTSFNGPKAEQFLPPCRGIGFEHVLVLVFFPFPQLLLQTLKSDHDEKLPCNGQGNELQLFISFEEPK